MASICAFCVFIITIGIQAVAAERFNGSLYYQAPTVQSSAGGCPSDVVREGTLSSIRQDVAAHLRNLTSNVIITIQITLHYLRDYFIAAIWGEHELAYRTSPLLKVAIVAGYCKRSRLVEWYM